MSGAGGRRCEAASRTAYLRDSGRPLPGRSHACETAGTAREQAMSNTEGVR